MNTLPEYSLTEFNHSLNLVEFKQEIQDTKFGLPFKRHNLKRKSNCCDIKYNIGECVATILIGEKNCPLIKTNGRKRNDEFEIDQYFPINRDDINIHITFENRLNELQNYLNVQWHTFLLYSLKRTKFDNRINFKKPDNYSQMINEPYIYFIAYGNFYNQKITLFERPTCGRRIKLIGYGDGLTIPANDIMKSRNKRQYKWITFLLSIDEISHLDWIQKVGFGFI